MTEDPYNNRPGASGSDLPSLTEADGLSPVHLAIYNFLVTRVANPPTMIEIRDQIAASHGAQTQTDRRVRELYPHVEIQKVRLGHSRSPGYRVAGPAKHSQSKRAGSVSGRVRAQVLSAGRCAMCGRNPLEDAVKLVVDHKLPQKWGGTDELENLQPLCEDCNGGKQAWFATMDPYANEIRLAAVEIDPHRRIGELLKAFHGDWVPSDLIGAVASMSAYQEDWQKRLRELRTLGWSIEVRKRHTSTGTRRVLTDYRATQHVPWPDGPTRAAIAAAERARRTERS